jgi:hypothetical protein
MNIYKMLVAFGVFCCTQPLFAQEYEADDSLHFSIDKSLKPKVLHAEPLYIDLIRDLGARKGEREWNVGAANVDRLRFDRYEALIEYEWAPIDRLGLEVELPMTFYAPVTSNLDATKPSNRIESLKVAAQWSFLVSQKHRTSLALGYINEFELVDLNRIRNEAFFTGNVFNPFLIAAKRLGDNWHSLVYTGPAFTYHFAGANWSREYGINMNLHYMIPNSRNFVGLEVNTNLSAAGNEFWLRPQMRLAINEQLLVGIVSGIPIRNPNEGLSSFVRLIYEPPHRIKKAHLNK